MDILIRMINISVFSFGAFILFVYSIFSVMAPNPVELILAFLPFLIFCLALAYANLNPGRYGRIINFIFWAVLSLSLFGFILITHELPFTFEGLERIFPMPKLIWPFVLLIWPVVNIIFFIFQQKEKQGRV